MLSSLSCKFFPDTYMHVQRIQSIIFKITFSQPVKALSFFLLLTFLLGKLKLDIMTIYYM